MVCSVFECNQKYYTVCMMLYAESHVLGMAIEHRDTQTFGACVCSQLGILHARMGTRVARVQSSPDALQNVHITLGG